jgi:hypothetical protein
MKDPSGSSGSIPRGIEVLVKKASIDRAFREILLEKRAESAAEIGLDLSAAEAAMLNAVQRAQIEQIIENTTVPDEHRREFLGRVGVAMLALCGLGISACDKLFVGPGGIMPDHPPYDFPDPSKGEARKSTQKKEGVVGREGREDKAKGIGLDGEGRK